MVSQRGAHKKNFNKLLFEAIDEVFLSLGKRSRTALYCHLETALNIKKREIPDRLEDFSRDLENIFVSGAQALEILLMKSLYAKIRDACELTFYEEVDPEMTLVEYVHLMRQNFQAIENVEKIEILINENEELKRARAR